MLFIMIWHNAKKEEVARELDSQPKKGLTDMTAGMRLMDYGENIRVSRRKRSRIGVLAARLLAPVSVLLIVLAGLSGWVNLTYYLTYRQLDLPLLLRLLFSAVMLAAVLTLDIVRTKRELSADKTIVQIKRDAAADVRVRRNGKIKEISAKQLVPGDIVQIQAGDIVPADGRLLVSTSLMCDENALTGDDAPVLKDAEAVLPEETPLERRINMVYSGTVAVAGHAVMMVTETGAQTQMARKRGKRPPKVSSRTRLVRNAYQTQGFFTWLVLCMLLTSLTVAALVFVSGLPSLHGVKPEDVWQVIQENAALPADYLEARENIPMRGLFRSLMFFVTLLVCTVPLGLPQNVIHFLAGSITRFRKEGVMLHRFRKAEVIGSTSVICTDKTGTLTKGEMRVAKAWPLGDETADVYEGFWSDELKYLMKSGVLCCDSKSVSQLEGGQKLTGDKTDVAIVEAYLKNGNDPDELAKQYPRCAEIPFDSTRRLMTVIHRIDGLYMVVTKGAPDALAARCADVNTKEMKQRTEELCREGLRVIAVAVHVLGRLPDEIVPDEIEKDLTFIGLLGIADPPREDVQEAVKTCKEAGIRTVMITGDQPDTARAIAEELHIMEKGGSVLTGEELSSLSDRKLRAALSDCSVFAGVAPEDKVRIVKAWQKKGESVLVTAGGLNDAAALHAADISCSVENTATDVATDAADISLSDGGFAGILSLIRQGRRIRKNLARLTEYSMACAVAQTSVLLLGAALFGERILRLLPLLVLNVFLYIFVQPCFAHEPAEKDVMKHISDPNNGRLTGLFERYRALLAGLWISFQSVVAYAVGSGTVSLNDVGGEERGMTMVFAVMGFGLVLHALCTRSDKPFVPTVIVRNYRMLLSTLAAAGLIAAMIMAPYVSTLMGFVPLHGREWCEIGILMAVQLAVWEYPKLYAWVKF